MGRKEENKKLLERFPWLSLRDGEYNLTYLDFLPPGWRDAFGIQMCEEIQAELEKFGWVDSYEVLDVKEKYGELRWYHSGFGIGELSDIVETFTTGNLDERPMSNYRTFVWSLDDKTDDGRYVFNKRLILEKCNLDKIIDKYTDLSTKICYSCGKKATKKSLGWVFFVCDECAEKVWPKRKFVDWS